MKRRLLRPVVLIPALVVASLAAGIAYATITQLDAGRVDANERLLGSLPLFPGAREVDRMTRTSADGALPVPDEVETSVLYAPPARVTQADVLEFFVGRLTPEWRASTRSVSVADPEEGTVSGSAFQVDFSRGDDCVRLYTYGMAPGHFGERTFALSAEADEGPCDED